MANKNTASVAARLEGLAEKNEIRQSHLAERVDLERVADKVRQLVTKDQLNEKFEFVEPLFNEAQDALRRCLIENAQMKEIIRKFDETICEKISKVHLLNFRTKLDDDFLTRQSSMIHNELTLSRERKLQQQITDLYTELNNVKQNNARTVEGLVNK